MLTVARPCAWSKDGVCRLPQAGARIARIDRLQCEQSARQLHMRSRDRRGTAKRSDRRQLQVETIVIRQIETKRHRPGRNRPLDHVEPNSLAVVVDRQMLATRPPNHPHTGPMSIE